MGEATQDEQGFDAIVVGTGPGGATVARELARRGARVLVLERGSDAPVRGTLAQAVRWLGMPGESLLLTTGGLPITRGVTLGGSSVFYYATAYEPPLADFDRLGIDLRPALAETRAELPIGPLGDRLMGPMSRRIMGSARALGLDWNPLDKLIDQQHCRTECWRCGYGCPYGAKWTTRLYVEDAVAHGAVLRADARVHRVLVRDGAAYGVEYTAGGAVRRALARQVILSAGGIGTPEILRKSGVEGVGKAFFIDPLIAVFGFVDDASGGPGPGGTRRVAGREVPMSAGVRLASEGYVMTDMTLPPALFRAMALARGRLWRLGQHDRALTIMVKIKDDLGGSIAPSGRIRKPLTAADRAKLDHGYAQARAILAGAGASGIFRSNVLAAHPGGTAKIGETVDVNLQTRLANLYVCDCSVIPEAWGLPPTLTLICLAKRLAGALAAGER